MNKKVLVFSSSGRVKGNSDLLSDMFIRGAIEKGHDVEKIALNQKEIKYCIGCSSCRSNNGKCIYKDDMQEILEKMIHADVLVFASPVYFYNFNAQMKTLIDRTYAREHEIVNKDAYLIATGAAPTKDYMDTIEDCFRKFIQCFDDIQVKGIVYGVGTINKGEVNGTIAMDSAYQMGGAI